MIFSHYHINEDLKKTNDQPRSRVSRVLSLSLRSYHLEAAGGARSLPIHESPRKIVRRSSKLVHGSLSEFSGLPCTRPLVDVTRDVIERASLPTDPCDAPLFARPRLPVNNVMPRLNRDDRYASNTRLPSSPGTRVARVITVIPSNSCS